MADYTISNDELKRAAAALLYVKEHGAEYDLADSIGAAMRERRREQLASGFERKIQAGYLADNLRNLVGYSIDRKRYQAAAEAVLVGSDERAVIDELLRFARELHQRVEKQKRSPARARRTA